MTSQGSGARLHRPTMLDGDQHLVDLIPFRDRRPKVTSRPSDVEGELPPAALSCQRVLERLDLRLEFGRDATEFIAEVSSLTAIGWTGDAVPAMRECHGGENNRRLPGVISGS